MHWLQQSCIGSTDLHTTTSVVDPGCVKAINNLLASKLPVNQMVDQVAHILKKQGLAYHSACGHTKPSFVPPPQQGQPNAFMVGHVGQRPEDDGHWYEKTIPWMIHGHRDITRPCQEV